LISKTHQNKTQNSTAHSGAHLSRKSEKESKQQKKKERKYNTTTLLNRKRLFDVVELLVFFILELHNNFY
jgi:hypothetical protein